MPIFYPCLKSCALHPELIDGTCGSGDDSVRIVGKWKSKELEFQKEYLKLVDEEPTSVMPNEMEKTRRELPRDPDIVTLFENINEAGPLPSC